MPLTCLACRAIFATSDLQRDHYSTEWHRYNLKRKVVELPPITFNDFELKQSTAAAEATVNATPEFSADKQLKCLACNKHFQSSKALENHLNSKKHIEKEKFRKELNRVPVNDSLLSRQSSESSDKPESLKNVDCVELVEKPPPITFTENDDDWVSDDEEMEIATDDESMETDEQENREQYNPAKCVFCEQILNTVEINIEHMASVHSFFIPYIDLLSDPEGFISYLHEKVYRYRMCLYCSEGSKRFRTQRGVLRHMDAKGHKRLKHDNSEDFIEYVDFFTDPSSEDGEVDLDIDQLLVEAIGDTYTLVLPSGATIGHRSLLRYYRQRTREQQPSKQRTRLALPGTSAYNSECRQLAMRGKAGVLATIGVNFREMRAIGKFKARNMLNLNVKNNKLKAHSRDHNFWSMRY